MERLYLALNQFIKDPFKKPLSLFDLALIIGVIMVIVIMWQFILREIGDTIGEI